MPWSRCTALRIPPFLVLLLSLLVLSRAAPAAISKIPTQVQLTISKSEITAGDTASIVVTLKDPNDNLVVASHPISVAVRCESMTGSNAVETFQLEIRTGDSSATKDLVFQVPGTVRIRARALYFPPATALLAVKEREGSASTTQPSPEIHDIGKIGAAPAELPKPEPHKALGNKALPPVTGVYLYVPAVVHPKLGVWTAQIYLVAINAAGKPQNVPEDLPVHLVATKGEVTPARIVIQAGYARSAEAIQLTSLSSGLDSIVAAPEGLSQVTEQVEYRQPEPSRIGIVVQPVDRRSDPDHSIATSATASVAVMLLDEMGHATPSLADATVMVNSTRGQLHPTLLPIMKGAWRSSEAQLTSFAPGEAEIRATATGMDGKHSVTFRFPWFLLLAATLGGLLGALIRDINSVLSRDRVKTCWRHLIVGLVMGAVVYGLSLFGALGTLAHQLDLVNVEAIPTANHFGAALLGFLGGYFGQRLLRPGRIAPVEEPSTVRPAGAGT